jgi:hypothetical protein
MKSTEVFQVAVERAHRQEEAFAAFLRDCGLHAQSKSRGFRASMDAISDYAHDVDLDVEGYRCQYKHRHTWLSVFQHFGSRPFVDEVIKADRTPVDFYILRFDDGTIVMPYEPERWGVEQKYDSKDKARKDFYTCDPAEGIPLSLWIESFLDAA